MGATFVYHQPTDMTDQIKTGLKQRLHRGEVSYGAWCMIPSPFVVEVFCQHPYDWVGIDLQHGLWAHHQMVSALQVADGAGLPALVRVNGPDRWEIGRVLDAGAAGVIVPMVDSRADAEEAVVACRYPPLGRRSFGPVRAALGSPGWSTDRANDEVLCVLMIETRGGLADLGEILTVEGVDAILVGGVDLSLTHGVFGDSRAHWELVGRVFDQCRRRSIPYGIAVGSVADAKTAVENGSVLVALSPDVWLIDQALQRYLEDCGIGR